MRTAKVILRGATEQTLAASVRECMELCDWETLVPRDATVVIKPNLCTTIPEKIQMSNTAPALTEAVCEVLLTRTRRIILGESDHLRQKAQQAFEATGYIPMARRLGVRLVNFSEEPWVPLTDSPIGRLELPKTLLEADVFITLPVLKTHALTYFTGALKNQWGCLPQYNRILHHKDLDELLVYLQDRLKPALTVMDGIVGMEGRGPVNGKPRRLDLILASRDAVALDATAMRLVGLNTALCRHIVLAANKGLGVADEKLITIDGDWEKHSTQYEPAVLDAAVAAMNYMSRYRWFVRHFLERDSIFYPVRSFVQVLRKMRLVEGG